MSNHYDVIVIGAGTGGYVAAIRAAQLGLKVVVVDAFVGKDGKPALGGTCLNVGCIPSKALLDSSREFDNLWLRIKQHGISVENPYIDLEATIGRKDRIVKQFTSGVELLLKLNKVTTLFGKAQVFKDKMVKVTLHGGASQTLTGNHIVLATGSVPVDLPFAPTDHTRILDSADALDLTIAPRRLGVIGAGAIGLEMGSVWQRLGSEVTILEALPALLPALDPDIARFAARTLTKQGLDIRLGSQVTQVQVVGDEVMVCYADAEGAKHEQTFDQLLVAVGRRAYVDGLFGEDIDMSLDDRGRIVVDSHNRTSIEGIWAVGDVVRGPMLAHKAMGEGAMVAELIAGKAGYIDPDLVPWVIYTDPELAWVGKTETVLKEAGVPVNIGTFPFSVNGRAVAMNEAVGQVKVVACGITDRILGVQILGPMASELIHECVVAMAFKATADDLARIVHAHPALSEVVHEAALSVGKRAIHKQN